MDDKTLAALKASIAHWRENEEAMAPYEARVNAGACALCGLFYWRASKCEGCPVAAAKKPYCAESPYYDAVTEHRAWLYSASSFLSQWRAREAFHNAAREERQFLESLLPSGERVEPA
jgi:hypothetical protein